MVIKVVKPFASANVIPHACFGLMPTTLQAFQLDQADYLRIGATQHEENAQANQRGCDTSGMARHGSGYDPGLGRFRRRHRRTSVLARE